MPKSEAQIQKEILDYLSAVRILHWRIPVDSVRTGSGARRKSNLRGFPDILGILPQTNGNVFFVEVKGPKGKLSEDQLAFHKKLRNEDCLVITAKSLEDVRYFIDPHLRTTKDNP